ncbi:MAG: rhodanese-like domain-containing protein [Candidatus Alcyoniella australis]|nr:rhodanese-like domain-containing protein [Candidatus Alcyoniella australis]
MGNTSNGNKQSYSDGPLSLRTLVIAALIVALAAAIGLGSNALRSDRIPWIYERTAPSATNPIDLEQAKELFDTAEALFLDSRSREEYDAGHISGALNVDTLDPEHIDRILEQALPGIRLVTYCSGVDCHSSDLLAERLVDMGYSGIGVFFGGWPEWSAAGYPTLGSGEQPQEQQLDVNELFPPSDSGGAWGEP